MTGILRWFDGFVEHYGITLARVSVGLLFVVTGIMSLLNFNGTASMIGSKGFPIAVLFAAIVIALKLGGGFSLIAGYKVRYGALALITFTVLATVFFHLSWPENVSFLKNLAIIGGLLLVYKTASRN